MVIYDVHEDHYQLFIDNIGNIISKALQKPVFRIIDRWEKNKASHYDAVIIAVDHIKRRFLSTGKIKECVTLFNYSFFNPINIKNGAEAGNKKYDLIYAGTMSAQRGIIELLLAIAWLKKNNFPVKLLLMGSFSDNNFAGIVTNLIRLQSIGDCVEIQEQVSFEHVKLYYEQCAVGTALFLPTLTSKILMPIKLFEYIALGLPVLSTNIGYTAEFVQKEKCGLICDPTNTQQLASNIQQLLQDKNLYNKLRINGLNASSNYLWSSMEKILLGLYDRLLQARIQAGNK